MNQNPSGHGTLDAYAVLALDGPYSKALVPISQSTYQFGGYLHPIISDGDFYFTTDDLIASANQDEMWSPWIYDDINAAWLYVTQHTTTNPGRTVASFPDFFNNFCCGFTFDNDRSVLINRDGAQSPDVVIHEVGHRYMLAANRFPFPITDPPTACFEEHGLFKAHPGGRSCAWTEGWANFFTSAVNGDPCYDFNLTGNRQPCNPNGAGNNFEIPITGSSIPVGDGVEGNIAGALWDMFDPVATWPDANADRYHGAFGPIWAIYMQNTYGNFRAYWDAWRLAGYNTHDVVIVIYNQRIDYDTPPQFFIPLPDAASSSLGGEYVVNREGYVFDVESTPAQLIYSLWSVSDYHCTASVDGAHSLHVRTAVDWVGACTVTVSASDEIYPTLSYFLMRAVPPRAWLPLVINNSSGGNQPARPQTNPYPLPGQTTSPTNRLAGPTPTPTPKTKPYPAPAR